MSHAHLGYPHWWKPEEEIHIKAPRVPDAEARLAAFRARDGEKEIAALARELFALVDPDSDIMGPAADDGASRMDRWGRYASRTDSELYGTDAPAEPCPRELLRDGKWAEALEGYKRRFFARMEKPPRSFAVEPMHPRKRDFFEFLNQPDELMENIGTFCMYRRPQQDETEHGIVMKIHFGESGAVNWLYTPPEYGSAEECIPDDEDFCPRCYSCDFYFDALVEAYVTTGDGRYIDKYCELLDDRAMFFRRGSAGTAQLRHWMWAAQTAPGFAERMSAATLARVLLNYWKYAAAGSIKITRGAVANRQIQMYLIEPFRIALSMPEFYPARYALREQVRVVESMYSCDVMPDGSNVENALCYNAHLLESWKYYRQMQALPEAKDWATPDWGAELRDNLLNTLRYIAQNQTLAGWDWYPMFYQNQRMIEYYNRFEPAYSDPVLRKWLPMSCHEGATAGKPNVTSLSWPYMGSAILRTGVDYRRDQECFMTAVRPSNTHQWKNNLDLQLFAFGQPLLTAHSDGYGYIRGPGQTNWEKSFRKEMVEKYNDPYRRGMHEWDFTPVFVDDCPQLDHAGYESMPDDYIAREGYAYGPSIGHRAYYTPQQNRWIESDFAAMMEGAYDGPFAEFEPDPNTYIGFKGAPGVVKRFIDDVTERRQVVLLKALGIWIVVDRLSAETAHAYKIDWKLAQKWERNGEKIPGFERGEVAFDEERRAFVTHNGRDANLSIFMNAAGGIEARYEPETNHYYGLVEGAGDQLAVSCLYPRMKDADALAAYEGFCADDQAGFDAETPDGTRVTVRAAKAGRAILAAGPLTAEAELVVYTRSPRGAERCFALGVAEARADGRKLDIPADCAFELTETGARVTAEAYLPMETVKIAPEAEVFADALRVSLVHPNRDADIRYTLDGTDPTLASPLYEAPFTVELDRVTVKARAFRRGLVEIPDGSSCTLASAVSRAAYRREPLCPADAKRALPGIRARRVEGDGFLNAFIPLPEEGGETRVARALFEGVTRADTDFAVEYEGYICVPKDGVYTFYAPMEFINNNKDSGYDLRLWLGKGEARREWYPSTRVNAVGGWSVALKRGLHALRVLYVDQRGGKLPSSGFVWRGEHPVIELAGPEWARAPLPGSWLYRDET